MRWFFIWFLQQFISLSVSVSLHPRVKSSVTQSWTCVNPRGSPPSPLGSRRRKRETMTRTSPKAPLVSALPSTMTTRRWCHKLTLFLARISLVIFTALSCDQSRARGPMDRHLDGFFMALKMFFRSFSMSCWTTSQLWTIIGLISIKWFTFDDPQTPGNIL